MSSIGIYGEELYEQVQPLHGPDPDGLLHDLIGAYVHGALEIDDLVRDDAQGRPGWGVILDVDECPVKGLPWLSQIAGVSLRDPKVVAGSLLPNPNSGDDITTSGWAVSTTAASTTVQLSPANEAELSDHGFDSRHNGTTSGTWTVIRSVGPAAVIPADPGAYYGVRAAFHLTTSTNLGAMTLKARWLDANLALLSETTLQTTAATLAAMGSGTTGGLYGAAQAPAKTAYVGLTLTVPVTAPGGDRHVYVGQFGAFAMSDPAADVPQWDSVPPSRLETDEEWAVYARDAIRRQGGKGRGTPDAILSAAEDTLTGNRSGRIIERVGGNAYALELVTRPSETPDPAATLAAAMTQKPAGMSLTHTLTEGAIIDEGTRSIDTATATIDSAVLSDIT